MPIPLPTRRVVLLGASNVARCVSTMVETAELTLDAPLDIMAALGHGRSFGRKSSVFGRKISGIISCGLWEELAEREQLPLHALITDIGNDILYGVPTDELIGWIETCAQRLASHGAKTIVTELPIENIQAIGSRRFYIISRLLFPKCKLSLEEALQRVETVNAAIRMLGEQPETCVLPVKQAWFGFDPIHLRRSSWRKAWPEIMAPWASETLPRVQPSGSIRRWFYLRTRVPKWRAIFGFEQTKKQPCGKLPSGSTISLY